MKAEVHNMSCPAERIQSDEAEDEQPRTDYIMSKPFRKQYMMAFEIIVSSKVEGYLVSDEGNKEYFLCCTTQKQKSE